MKKSLFIAFALAAICLMASCKKEPTPNVIVPDLSKVVFGQTDGMIVTTFDSTAMHQGNDYEWSYSIDLNGDNIKDIKLESVDWGSTGLGHQMVTILNCTSENVAILGEVFDLNTYLHSETSSHYYSDPTYPQFDSIFWINIKKTYTCEKIAEDDSLYSSKEAFTPRAGNAGEAFTKDDVFKNTLELCGGHICETQIILKNRDYYYPSEPEGWGTDTITNYVWVELNSCHDFPLVEEKYIGFKVTGNDRERLGWMKIIIEERYGDYYVRLFETAIQE